ncbi:hypothetical protein LKL35_34850 [Streptomyces sp. ET3-23]|uniref:hypothetical protein n=1 Tax=Streptomyces sp. ET3-23 TaxID=2885643 RepID=UPI001D1193A2|nr:hypothetical protein [Streptomyces sp. ET3-23]MCC2280546.1 hypothetical protein [Streptomyces sp. ET3-23]
MTRTEQGDAGQHRHGSLLEPQWSTDRETVERLWDALHRLEPPGPRVPVSPQAHHVPLPLMTAVPVEQPVRPRRHARARHRRRRGPGPGRLLRKRNTVLLVVVPAACAIPLIPPLVR